MFLVYVNDLSRSSSQLTPILFADDASLFISDSNIEIFFEATNEELRKVATWSKVNNLSLNISEIKYALFNFTKKNHIPNILPPLHIEKVQINSEFVTTFLRVYLDENIFWKHHMNIVSTKICKSIGILSRNRCILRKCLWKQYYFYFINCYLNYANIAWASTSKSKIQAFYHHQKHAARIINFKDKFTSAKPLLEQINAMTVYEMNIFQTLCFIYLCKNGNTANF